MKKILVFAVVFLLLTSCAGASELANRFGMGINWLGGHMRYVIGDHWIAEGKVQVGFTNTLVGPRVYYLLDKIPGDTPLFPYAGIEYGYPISQYLTGGYEAGLFLGVESLVNNNLGLGVDVGLCYVDIWSELGGLGDMGLIFNVFVTYYFEDYPIKSSFKFSKSVL